MSLRLAVLVLGVLWCSWLDSAAVQAQGCHTPAIGTDDARKAFRAVAGVLVASYDHGPGARGDYEGLYTELRYRQPWFAVGATLPAYRLARSGHEVALGLGDLTLTVSGTALRALHDELTVGVELPVMVPTGDQARSLGMGHVMLMPHAWLALDLEPFALRAELGYGRALGASAGGEHAGHMHDELPTPIVNPMNRSEFEHALSLLLGLQRYVFAHVRWLGAVPIGHGSPRQILGGGLTLRFEWVDVTAELAVPVLGNPFDIKGLLQSTVRF
jgi:hypothetical protein